MPKKVSLENNK